LLPDGAGRTPHASFRTTLALDAAGFVPFSAADTPSFREIGTDSR